MDLDPLQNLGIEYLKSSRFREAVAIFSGILSVYPDNAAALNGISAAFTAGGGLGYYSQALSYARKACEVESTNPEYWNTLLQAARLSFKLDEAEEALYRVEQLNFKHWGFYENAGLLYYLKGNFERSLDYFNWALDLSPDNKQVLHDRAYPILAMKDYKRGWVEHEYRWFYGKKSNLWNIGIPLWEGQDLDRKALLVHHEQGLGDTIQWLRFCEFIKNKWDVKITVVVPKVLINLISTCSYIDSILDFDNMLTPTHPKELFDFHIPIFSLGKYIDFNEGSFIVPYLSAPDRDWSKLNKEPGYKVGLVWRSAHTGMDIATYRSINLLDLLPIFEIPGISYYSLQTGPSSADIGQLELSGFIRNPVHRIEEDFAETASLMQALDLIVTIDSAVLHVAGAIGKETIGLLYNVCCWRWNRNSDRSDWYPSIRFLRQSEPNEWKPVIDDLVHILRGKVKDHANTQ